VNAETTDDDARDRVVDLIIALHEATPVVERIAGVEDFTLPGRWSVQQQLDARHVELPAGPYARSFRDLIADHRRILSEVLLAYDRMAICARLSAGTPGPPWAQPSESRLTS